MANKNNANDAGKKNEGLSSSTSKDDLDSLMTTDTTESQMRNCALKGISEQYVEFRETARLLMFLIGESGYSFDIAVLICSNFFYK